MCCRVVYQPITNGEHDDYRLITRLLQQNRVVSLVTACRFSQTGRMKNRDHTHAVANFTVDDHL